MIGDTICAVASPAGSAERGILRVSGPGARSVADAVLDRPLAAARAACERAVTVLDRRVEALVLWMPGPRSFTGEDVVELHLPGSPLLLARVEEQLQAAGARPATPGEFTRRAFEHGRLSLTEAEAVGELIWAASSEERRFAVDLLQGGVDAATAGCRDAVQDALALVEADLDFEDGETGAVDHAQCTELIGRARERVAALEQGVPQGRAVGGVALLGAANAGKSSLCNALCGRDAVIVADLPGTTRDLVAVEVEGVTLFDAPGDLDAAEPVDRAALALRERVPALAGLAVVDATAPRWSRRSLPLLAVAVTKCDLACAEVAVPSGLPRFDVSSLTGAGIGELREFLVRSAGRGPSGAGMRVAAEAGAARAALERAHGLAGRGREGELVAFELGEALAALDRIAGRSSPEELLDRIFGRFCLGK